MTRIITLFFAVVCITISSCSNDEPCQASIYTNFSGVVGPNTVQAGEPIVFQTSILINNTCGSFGHFEESNGYPKIVSALVDYKGCECVTQSSTVTEEYTVTINEPGSYLFKFPSANGYWEKTVEVTE